MLNRPVSILNHPRSLITLVQTLEIVVHVMWFKRNGHFAKIEKTESEVPNEFPKIKTALHQRV